MSLFQAERKRGISPRFRPYREYKEFGTRWPREMPAHWEKKRLRYACRINPGRSGLTGLSGSLEVSFLPMESIGENGQIELNQIRTLDQVWQGYTYFEDGDVIIAKITPCFENGKGALCQNLISGIGFGTTELHVLRPVRGIYPRFLFYLTKSHAFRTFGATSMRGAAGQQRVTDEFVKDFVAGFPPLTEQRAIARFLDRETAKIDTLIEKKQRLLELLKEKRSALISQAVTNGLDPTSPTKDSGVRWLGNVPSHWEIRRLKYAVRFRGGGTPSKDVPEYWNGDIPWISPKDMRHRFISDSEDHVSGQGLLESATRLIDAGTVIIVVRSGILRHTLPVAITERPVALNQDMKALIPKKELVAQFLFYLIEGFQNAFLVEWRKEGATVESLEFGLIANTPIPVPPVAEQQAIVTFLDRETGKIDSLISKIREAIDKLKEYRVALISAAVTGRIDVRGEVS